MTLDDLLLEISYQLPKGYPTIVDGKFVDREEVLLINKFLLERGIGKLPVPEATKVTKELTKFQKWYNSQSKSDITPFIETFPIVEALIDEDVTLKSFIATVSQPQYDWHPKVVEYLKDLKSFLSDPDSVRYFNEIYVRGKAPSSPISQQYSLKSLNNGKKITSFIHNHVRDVYDVIQTGEKNKVFTADVFVFWGVTDPGDDVIEALSLAVYQPKIKNKSLIDLGNNRYVACVSLKASSGRLGKWTDYAGNYVKVADQSGEVSENVVSDLASKFAKTAIGKTLLTGFEKIKTMFADLYNKIKSVVSEDNVAVKQFEDLSKTMQEFDMLIDEPSLTEGDNELITCSTCMQDKLKRLDPYVQKVLAGNGLDDIKKVLKPLIDGDLFVANLSEFNKSVEQTKKGYKQLETVYKKILKAKPSVAEVKSKCAVLRGDDGKELKVSRADLKNILFTNSNTLSFDLIKNMINQTFGSIKPNEIKQKKDSLIKLSVTLASEMVFGTSAELPLVKYVGVHAPMELGTKAQYKEAKMKQANAVFGSKLKLPVSAISIYPSKGKTGETPYYYVVKFFTFYNIEQPTGGYKPEDVSYAVTSFKCNSGSDFAFAVEADDEINGTQLLKAVTSKDSIS